MVPGAKCSSAKAGIATMGDRNKNILKFRFDTKLLGFVFILFRFELTFSVKSYVSFPNPRNFVSLCVRNQTVKDLTYPE